MVPDGSHILATSVAGPVDQPKLWRLSAMDGAPRKLNDEGREAAVSPNGLQIVFLKGAAKSQELWLMSADGEQRRRIADERGDLFRSPVWSADGTQIAFLRAVYHPGTLGIEPQIEILDLASNTRRVVFSHVRLGPALAWINDHFVHVMGEAPPARMTPISGR